MAINKRSRALQLTRLRGAVNLWSPSAFDDGVAPQVNVVLGHSTYSETFRARVLDVAVPYNDLAGPPLLVVRREGDGVAVFIPSNQIVSISDGERIVS